MSKVPIDGIWTTPRIKPPFAGYMSFNEVFPSDHQCLWIDVPQWEVYGCTLPPIVCPSPHHLNSKDPTQVEKYNSRLKAVCLKHHYFERLQHIEQEAENFSWNYHLEYLFNSIHAEIEAHHLATEKTVRKLRMGSIPWSPQLEMYRLCIELWSKLYSRHKGGRTITNRIRWLLHIQPPKLMYSR